MPVRPMLLHRVALVSFRLFCKNLGNLQEFFGQMVYCPLLAENCPYAYAFRDEINNEFETLGKYNFLVSQTMRSIAKSPPRTLDLKSTIFEHRIGFLWKNHLH